MMLRIIPIKYSHSTVVRGDDGEQSALRGLLIVLALSIHELFEGLSVGFEFGICRGHF